MTEEQDRKRRDLTFSQREGKVPLPESLQPQHLTTKFRSKVWRVVHTYVQKKRDTWDPSEDINSIVRFWNSFFFSYQTNVLYLPHDLPHDDDRRIAESYIREKILEAEYHEVLTIIEHMFRCPDKPEGFESELESCFDESLYIVDRSMEPICISPTTSEEMKQSVSRSLDNISQSKLTGAKSHLHKATEELKKNNFADSIRESIHAVEATVGEIAPKFSGNFNKDLNSLEENGMVKHPALKGAFKKLYGYTSDEEGIRHSLLDKESADVGYDEAIFMYGACVSFIDYLVSKQRNLEKK